MPLEDVEFQAGITTILEAMAMEQGRRLHPHEGPDRRRRRRHNGLYVPPGDSGALRAAITKLLDEPELAAEMGQGGRDFVERECDVSVYARRLAERRGRGERRRRDERGSRSTRPSSRRRCTCLSDG